VSTLCLAGRSLSQNYAAYSIYTNAQVDKDILKTESGESIENNTTALKHI